ncbi:MAG: glycosyltransferase family 2 protein [Spirochaetaceae bacterium]|nr:MAG: glycosyltransferase family 2 protein [Spirochaetaceae bacterium]
MNCDCSSPRWGSPPAKTTEMLTRGSVTLAGVQVKEGDGTGNSGYGRWVRERLYCGLQEVGGVFTMTEPVQDSVFSRWGVVVFSYNRGEMLGNSIRSVMDCAPNLSLIVWDDRSEDPDTLAVLEEYRSRGVEVRSGVAQEGLRGGLYANMAAAMKLLLDRGVRYAVFTQDDVQFVRRVGADDLLRMEEAFASCPEIGEISVCFKAPSRAVLQYHERCGVYINPARHHSAVGAFDLQRLRDVGWQPVGSEERTDQLTRELGLKFAVHPFPFMMWLVNARTYGAHRGLANRFADRWMRYGFFPYRYMTDHEIEALKDRDVVAVPISPAVLSFAGEPPARPYSYIAAKRKLKKRGLWRYVIGLLSLTEKRQRGRLLRKAFSGLGGRDQ